MKCRAASFLLIALMTASAWADEPFFPDLVFDKDPEHHESTAEWYGKHLKAAKEPSLYQFAKADPEAAGYRFLFLPCFYRPISVRVNRTNSAVTLRAVQLDGMGGYEPGKVVFDQTKKLTENDWDWLQVHVDEARFWEMATHVESDNNILDADHWIMEGAFVGKYHVISRADPDEKYEKLCKFILNLSNLDLEYPYIPEQTLSGDKQYTQILKTMKEPSLWRLAGSGDRAYRFLWVRPNASLVALRIEEIGREDDDGGNHAPALHILESRGNEPVHHKRVKLSRDKWQEFLRELDRVHFWELPAETKAPSPAEAPHLILEGANSSRKRGKYHAIDRAGSSPHELQPLLKFVTDLAGPDLRKLLDAGTPKP